jgi:DNA-binding transcriptional MerR regulator
LRYYESIGVISPVGRGESSRHRVYTDEDLNLLIGVACLSATGMSVRDMRSYVANRERGQAAAKEQIALLSTQRDHLAREAELITLRQRYVALKIDYWKAVDAGDEALVQRLSNEARALADDLAKAKKN